MADFNLRTFPYAGLAVPSESPFFPVIMNVAGERKVKFNRGYVLDYQSLGEKGVKAVKVEMDESYEVKVAKKYYVEIKTSAESASVTSAEIKDGDMSAEPKFHYGVASAANGEPYVGVGTFHIPLCSIDANGSITEIYLRENIHWQKINFENIEGGTNDAEAIGVLHDWGDSENKFGDNPRVKFKSIVQKGNNPSDPTDQGEQFIKIEESPEKNIVVTTQLPAMSKDKPLVLVRDKTNVWKWMEFPVGESGPTILYYDEYGEAGFKTYPFSEGVLVTTKAGDNFVFNQVPYPNSADYLYLAHKGQPTELPSWQPASGGSGTAGSGSLPTGVGGDILYHNNTDWVVLNKPYPAPTAGQYSILTHAGGNEPAWTLFTTGSLDTCGGPVSILIPPA